LLHIYLHLPQFFEDWNSMTKFEGSYIGHTFVARLASDPRVVIDTYTLEPTRIIDCPNLKQQVSVASKDKAEAVVEAQGTIQPLQEPNNAQDANTEGASIVTATAGATSISG
jgi:hypothetical protein